MNTPNEDPKLLPPPDDDKKALKDAENIAKPETPENLENQESVEKGDAEIQKIQKETKQEITEIINDPGQNLVALADSLREAGFNYEMLSSEEMKNVANMLSIMRKGPGEGMDASFDFNAKFLKFLEQGDKSNQQLEEIKKQLTEQYSAKEMSGIDDGEMIKKFEELITYVQKNSKDEKKINIRIQREIKSLKNAVEKLEKGVGSGTLGSIKSRINKIALWGTFLFFLAGGVMALYQNWLLGKLQEDVEKHATTILGKDFDPDDSFKKVMNRAKEWEKKYEEEHGKLDIEKQGWEKERKKFMKEAEAKHGELTARALDIERLMDELKRAKEGAGKWDKESKESKEATLMLAKTVAKLQTELVKTLGNSWFAYGIAARDPQRGKMFTSEARKSFARAINELIKEIGEDMSAQAQAGPEVPKPWGEAKNNGKKCIESIEEAISGLEENDFPFEKGGKEKLREVMGKIR